MGKSRSLWNQVFDSCSLKTTKNKNPTQSTWRNWSTVFLNRLRMHEWYGKFVWWKWKMANLPHSYQFFLFFCRLLLCGSDKKTKKQKLLVHLTMLNLQKCEQPNWIIGTNLGLVTIRGGYCDLNVRFPHLHLRNKLVKTFLVSRLFFFFSRDNLVSKHSCIRLVLRCWVNMQKPTCSLPEGVNNTAALRQSVSPTAQSKQFFQLEKYLHLQLVLSSAPEGWLPTCVRFVRRCFKTSFAAGSPRETGTKSNLFRSTQNFPKPANEMLRTDTMIRSYGQ